MKASLHFYKYQGTGNDFILIDNREGKISLTKEQIALLCHRRFGIGADGLMLLELAEGYDFRMVYYNADGGESTMCGNGGRCIAAFAHRLGIIDTEAKFIAIDGPHDAKIDGNIVSLRMADVNEISHRNGYSVLNTGSPHYVKWTDNTDSEDVFSNGRSIRNDAAFAPGGINVNFVQRTADGLIIRTYERGVEDETMSCGTGVTAGAIAATGEETGSFDTAVKTPGGSLNVSFFKPGPATATEVILTGPAKFVYKGTIAL